MDGDVGTLRHVADVLTAHGVASLRYDKVGTGATGLGGPDVADIGFDRFVDDGRAALRFLTAQPGVDADRLVVVHSEGGLIAELLAAEADPAVDLVLVAPVPHRFLDVATGQIERQLDQSGAADGRWVARSPPPWPPSEPGARPRPPPRNSPRSSRPAVRFLPQVDAHDPVAIAKRIPAAARVLLTCGGADIQVSCSSLAELRNALGVGTARRIDVRLDGVDHVLKEVGDSPSTGAEYGQPLPFSTAFDMALVSWLAGLATSR